MKIFRNIDQGSADWFRIRMGIPTASCFDQILTPKTRKLSASWKMYACRLIAERLLNQPMESIEGQKWMERGKELEPEAVRRYEAVHDVDTTAVTFIKTDDGTMGCSPDRVEFSDSGKKLLIKGNNEFEAGSSDIAGLFEAKCPSLPVWLKYNLFGRGPEYECQLQGQMWCADTDRDVFYAYFPGAPKQVKIVTYRDEEFIKDLGVAMREFQDKLHEYHLLALSLGDWQSFKEVVTPWEIEEADNLNMREQY
jgi:YqaJ-like viral recombinase domain